MKTLYDIAAQEYVITYEAVKQLQEYELSRLTKRQLREEIKPVRNSSKDPKIQRNEPCPCGSGVKYKKCCINQNPYE